MAGFGLMFLEKCEEKVYVPQMAQAQKMKFCGGVRRAHTRIWLI
jgi:hypothetical protein